MEIDYDILIRNVFEVFDFCLINEILHLYS